MYREKNKVIFSSEDRLRSEVASFKSMGKKASYQSDINDAEWRIIKPLLSRTKTNWSSA